MYGSIIKFGIMKLLLSESWPAVPFPVNVQAFQAPTLVTVSWCTCLNFPFYPRLHMKLLCLMCCLKLIVFELTFSNHRGRFHFSFAFHHRFPYQVLALKKYSQLFMA